MVSNTNTQINQPCNATHGLTKSKWAPFCLNQASKRSNLSIESGLNCFVVCSAIYVCVGDSCACVCLGCNGSPIKQEVDESVKGEVRRMVLSLHVVCIIIDTNSLGQERFR